MAKKETKSTALQPPYNFDNRWEELLDNEAVITSYSIHYTKLYELMMELGTL